MSTMPEPPFDFLGLRGRTVLVAGVANRRSVATHVARLLLQSGTHVLLSVQSDEHARQARSLFPEAEGVFVCDATCDASIATLAQAVGETLARRDGGALAGFVHSLAFANYSAGPVPFHEVKREDFLQAVDASCFSLVAMSNALRPHFMQDASVVTVSISTTKMAAENYGYMAPVKAALDSTVVFLAKSFSSFSRIRFNAIAPGLLKTSASAGIPGYLDSYLYAERATLRKQAVTTEEAANAAVFLLSPRSSGINAQLLVIDAGMSTNYFDREIVTRVARSTPPQQAPPA